MSTSEKSGKKSLRKRLVSSLKPRKDSKRNNNDDSEEQAIADTGIGGIAASVPASSDNDSGRGRRTHDDESASTAATETSKKPKRRGEGFVRRMRSLSRSRSRSGQKGRDGDHPKTIVTVTSSRSDGYYNQKAPGSTSKLPRKAPTNLKLFHELAVGVKDAYAAVGQTPREPVKETNEHGMQINEREYYARNVLWVFIGNIDFVRSCNPSFQLNPCYHIITSSVPHTVPCHCLYSLIPYTIYDISSWRW